MNARWQGRDEQRRELRTCSQQARVGGTSHQALRARCSHQRLSCRQGSAWQTARIIRITYILSCAYLVLSYP